MRDPWLSQSIRHSLGCGVLRVALLMVLSAPKETVQVKITLGVKSFFFFDAAYGRQLSISS